MRKLLSATVVVALTGCATAPTTPYQTPQVSIRGVNTEAVKLDIIQSCVSGGGVIEQNTPNQIICSKPMDDSFKSLMFRALATPKYSTNPNGKVRYSFVEASGQVYVTADMYLEYQTAFGQVNRTPITNGNVAAQAQAMFDRIRARHEGGIAAGPTDEPTPDQATPASTTVPASGATNTCKACSTIHLP